MLARSIFVALGLAALASAQADGIFDSGDDASSDFPSACTDACQPFETAAASCTMTGDSQADEAASFGCICTIWNARYLESCGSCVVGQAETSPNAAATVQQLAISFTRGCGIPLWIDGVDDKVSSVLADGGSDYSSERAALLSSEALYTTESNGMAVTLTASTTSTPTSTGASQTAASSAASAASPSQTGDAVSAASFASYGPASLLLAGGVALVAQLA